MTTWLLTYLLNALWQIPLLFAAAFLAARLLRPAGPLAEHRVWITATVLQVVLPACSGNPRAWLHALHLSSVHGGQTAGVTIAFTPASFHAGLHLPPTLGRFLLAAWALTILFSALRLLLAIRSAAALRRSARPLVLAAPEAEAWRTCRTHFRLPATTGLATSETVRTPITLGLRNPLVLIPATLFPTLAPDDLETILLHESAHIARHDFPWNLVLQVLILPTRFHPFTAITLARLTETREIVCDTLAAEAAATPILDGRTLYARSLLRLASTLAEGPRTVTPHPLGIGIFDAQTLERRIMNLTHSTIRPSLLRRATLAAAALTLAAVTSTGALALRTTVAPSDPVRVFGGVMAGQLRSRVSPKYPQAAKDAHIQGTVLLHALIGKDGVVDQLTVISGAPELTPSALDAVRQWTYEPYLLNGQPTEVDTTITITYTLAQ